MTYPPRPFLVDTHQDIAYHCQEFGRDFIDPQGAACMIALPWLQAAGIRLICATLFTPHNRPASQRRYLLYSQFTMYTEWFARYPEELWLIRSQADLARLALASPVRVENRVGYPVGVILLMEGCELLESWAELTTWYERGLRVLGLTWNGTNQYASGVFSDGGGLRPQGYRMLAAMQELGMILDLAHLTARATAEALEFYQGPLCSSHTNAFTLCSIERNLTDRLAQELATRGGVIGLNLLAPLLIRRWQRDQPLPKLHEALSHTCHFAELLGPAHVGIGADLDGGLTPENTPEGISRIDDLPLLGAELKRLGWSPDDVERFEGRNWWDFFARYLPA